MTAPTRVVYAGTTAESPPEGVTDAFDVEVATEHDAVITAVATADCLVVADIDSPLSLVASVRTVSSLPVVLYGDGDERFVSDAVSVGISEYVARSRDGDAARLATAIADVVADRLGTALLQTALDRSPIGTLILDSERRITWANDAVCDYFGLDRETIVGRSKPELLREDMADVLAPGQTLTRDVLASYDAGEDIERLELHVTGGSVPERWLDYWSIRLTPGDQPSPRVEQFYDITERKRLEAELSSELDALEQLYEVSASDRPFREKVTELLEYGTERMDASIGALNQIDGDVQRNVVAVGDGAASIPTVTPANEAFCRRTVESDGLVAAKNTADEFGDDTAVERWGAVCYIGGKVVVDGEPFGSLCFMDGEPKSREFSAFDETFVRLLARWVSYELEREQAAAELARENERLERFASVVSHDLRSPLSVATGYMQMAYEDGDEDAYERVVNSLERMDDIIDDVLAVTRQGGEVTDPTTVDLAALARSAWEVTDADAATLTADSVTVEGDADRLQRLFENLFRNAVEHGGATEIRVGPLDDEDGFYVEDDGSGIPAEDREQVFDDGFTTSDSGTGFGLAIVKAAAEAHGWEPSVTESASGGARFEFTPRTSSIYA
ncbi:PAS domain-containing sensor histidine kinase [Halosegnis longus]|uniref:histidine kinase n=1 Tax=Halosegnis longus TaxID=2216012 RepID=A0AAJ4UVQ1_9EURY|nr:MULTISPECIES: ATP-binding protein [Halobacteriales]RNJ26226.1 PAS domain S-box protein [Salella cibi]